MCGIEPPRGRRAEARQPGTLERDGMEPSDPDPTPIHPMTPDGPRVPARPDRSPTSPLGGGATPGDLPSPPAARPARRRALVAAIVAASVLLASGVGLGWVVGASRSPSAPASVRIGSGPTTGAAGTTQGLADRVSPAGVDIKKFPTSQ